MDYSIYEVTRDEYVGFINQINPRYKTVKTINSNKNITEIQTFSLDETRHFASRIIDTNYNEPIETYYVFDMPLSYERQSPKAVRKINLETKEEVQAFFDILAKLQKEKKND